MQLIDRHLHGGLIHFGVHSWAAGKLWPGFRPGWAGWAGGRPGLLKRCTGLGSASPALGLGRGEGCRRDPKPGKHSGLEGK